MPSHDLHLGIGFDQNSHLCLDLGSAPVENGDHVGDVGSGPFSAV